MAATIRRARRAEFTRAIVPFRTAEETVDAPGAQARDNESVTDPTATPVLPPLRIGNLTIDTPVELAPMAGVTNAAFRRLCREAGSGLYVAEMVTSRALVERTPEIKEGKDKAWWKNRRK